MIKITNIVLLNVYPSLLIISMSVSGNGEKVTEGDWSDQTFIHSRIQIV